LTTFKLTGILQEPSTPENITLETIKWELERPNQFIYIDEKLKATYTSDEISSTFHVIIGAYDENSVAYLGADYVDMAVRMNSTITNPNGFIESVRIVLRKGSQPSLVDWLLTYLNFTNLSVIDLAHGGKNYQDAYIQLAGVNHTDRIYFSATAVWSLLTPNNQTHQMEAVYELTYYNGTVYKKIIQPFQLKIVGR
jgi:hypothetical protein